MSDKKRICKACVDDTYLKAEIDRVGGLASCSYCECVAPTIDMESLAELCDLAIANFYEVSSLSDAVTLYGRDPEGDALPEVLEQLLGVEGEAQSDLVELLTDSWFDYPSHEYRYGEEPYFIAKTKLSAPLHLAWQRMERSIRHETRIFNPIATRVLESVFGPVIDDRTYEGKEVIVVVGPNSSIERLYRARVFQSLSHLEEALRHPERTIGPPPAGIGRPGRMNAQGVSVFYGATEKNIAIAEVRPPVGSHLVMGSFQIIRELRLLDLDELGVISVDSAASVFDPSTVEKASRGDFLQALTKRMVMPVMPEHEEAGYLITQAIADFLASHPKLALDGILFKSAQRALAASPLPGRNVILFNKASGVLRSEQRYGEGTRVSLFCEDDSGAHWEPEIWTEEMEGEERPVITWGGEEDESMPSLELDRSALEIYEIRGVAFQTFAHDVKQSVVPRVIKKPKF